MSFSRLITLFPSTKDFEKFITDVNKTFGGATAQNRIYFNIPQINLTFLNAEHIVDDSEDHKHRQEMWIKVICISWSTL